MPGMSADRQSTPTTELLKVRLREVNTMFEAVQIANLLICMDSAEWDYLLYEHFGDECGAETLRAILRDVLVGCHETARDRLLRAIESIAIGRWPQSRIEDAA